MKVAATKSSSQEALRKNTSGLRIGVTRRPRVCPLLQTTSPIIQHKPAALAVVAVHAVGRTSPCKGS